MHVLAMKMFNIILFPLSVGLLSICINSQHVNASNIDDQNITTYVITPQVRINASGMFCSGVFITKNHIITSAQCVFENQGNLSNIEITVKVYNDSAWEDSEIRVAPEWVLVHAMWDSNTLEHNIAIIKTIISTNLIGNEIFMNLPINEDFMDSKTALLMAWDSCNDSNSHFVHEYKLLDKNNCKNYIIQDLMAPRDEICAERIEENTSLCKVVAGAPLFLYKNGQLLIGIVSVGISVETKNIIVFSNVYKHIDWIHSITNNNNYDAEHQTSI